MELKEGITFANHYLLQKRLGRGSFGEVWLAKNILAEIPVAVKVYGALDDNGLNGFREEFQLAYKLSHPNLLHINHFDIADNHPFLVMPYCKNGSSVKYIGNVSEKDLWRFIRDVSAGLMYLHEQVPSIVHQDIKPDNILINDDGHFVISDFGISHRMSTTFSRLRSEENVSSGTLAYMAPEHFSQNQARAGMASDIWSLGMTIYEMATGEVLWNGIGGCAQINGAHTPYEISGFSSRLSSLVSSCLMLNALERPTARQLNEMAQSVLDGNPMLTAYESLQEIERNNNVTGGFQNSSHNVYSNSKSNGIANNISSSSSNNSNYSTKNRRFNVKYAIYALIAIACSLLAFIGIRSFANSINENSDFVECKTIEDYKAFIKNYPESERLDYAKRKIEQLINDSILEANNSKGSIDSKPSNIVSSPTSNGTSKVIYVNEDNSTNKSAKKDNASSSNYGSNTPLNGSTVSSPNNNQKDYSRNKSQNDYSQQTSDDDDRYFASCRTIADYQNYLQNFPNGKNANIARHKIEQLQYDDMNSTHIQTVINNNYDISNNTQSRISSHSQTYSPQKTIRQVNNEPTYRHSQNYNNNSQINRGSRNRPPVRNGRR